MIEMDKSVSVIRWVSLHDPKTHVGESNEQMD